MIYNVISASCDEGTSYTHSLIDLEKKIMLVSREAPTPGIT